MSRGGGADLGDITASLMFLDNNRKHYDVAKHEKSVEAKLSFLSAFRVFY